MAKLTKEKSMVTLPERMATAYKAMEELRVASHAIDNTAGRGTKYVVRPPEGKEFEAVEMRVGGAHSEVWGREAITAEDGFEATSARLSIDGLSLYGERRIETEAEVIFTRPGKGNNRYSSEWELTIPAQEVAGLTVERVQ